MKTRTISSVIITIILVIIGVVNKPFVDTTLLVILSLLGVYEYNKAFKNINVKPISWVGYLGCFFLFAMGGVIPEESKMLITKILLPLSLIIIFMYIILTKLKRTIVDVAITLFSLLYIPFMFSFIKLILMMEHGRLLVIYVFLAAFASDIFAYLIGSKFGKHKLCPDISPKKTIEGSVGGIVGVIVTFIILTIVANNIFGMSFSYINMIIAGVVAGIAGQFGDLSASAIKRYCKIKDFGYIIPGHGGILDRFDSVIFVAPVMYMFLKLYL